MRRATPPATIMPRAEPEMWFMEAAPVAGVIGLPVEVGPVETPVVPMDLTVGLATPELEQA